MKAHCPKCGREIAAADINAARGVAFCRACDEAFELDKAGVEGSPDTYIVDHPPAGVVLTPTADGFCLLTTARIPHTVMLVFGTLFWNGIVSIFVVSFVSSVLANGWSGKYGNEPPPAVVGLVLLPFVAIGLAFLAMVATLLFGRVEVSVDGSAGSVFTGVGPVGFRRRFDLSKVTSVSEVWCYWAQRGPPSFMIVLHGDKATKFGLFLSDERRRYIVAVLRHYLAGRYRV